MALVSKDTLKKFGRTYEDDDIIVCEYEKGTEAYFVLSGKVKLTRFTGDKEIIVDFLSDGSFFGEMAILEEAPRTASAFAVGKVETLVFDKNNFETLLRSNPNLGYALLEIIALRIKNARRRLLTHMLPGSKGKLADAILNYISRFKRLDEIFGVFDLDITIEEAAKMAGLSEEEAREVLEEWQYEGKMEITKDGRLRVLSIDELQRDVAAAMRELRLKGGGAGIETESA